MTAYRALALPLLAVVACHCGEKVTVESAADAAVITERKPATTNARCPVDSQGEEIAAVGGAAGEGKDPFVAALGAFGTAYDAGRYEEALACAQEAIRIDGLTPEAHIDKGFALEALNEPESARDAYERALAIDPENPEALRAAANFLVDRGTDDALETAALYARRGRDHAEDTSLGAELATIEASALNGLGKSAEALAAAESSLALDGEHAAANVERGVALFELLRFDESRAAFESARKADPENAKTAYYLALLEERDGHDDKADALFAEAAKLDADAYPPALLVDAKAFDALVQGEIARLGEEDRKSLAGTAFQWTELPALEDLKAGDPVLSPTIVGLYRPAEEGQKDQIYIYRRNLLRLCRTQEELHREVRDTILHELGHLNGADDAELRDRGL